MLSMTACSYGNKLNGDDEKLIFKEETSSGELKHYQEVPNDMVLIYDGGAHRSIKWNKEHFAPYVSAEMNGKASWLFDGFLFWKYITDKVAASHPDIRLQLHVRLSGRICLKTILQKETP